MANEEAMEAFAVEMRGDAVIALHGDLTGEKHVYEHLNNVFWKVSRGEPTKWVIHAAEARVAPEGVNYWIRAVHEHLTHCELRYLPSQLSLILQYDDRYQHRASTFEEY